MKTLVYFLHLTDSLCPYVLQVEIVDDTQHYAAQSKVSSKDNEKHTAGGGNVSDGKEKEKEGTEKRGK